MKLSIFVLAFAAVCGTSRAGLASPLTCVRQSSASITERPCLERPLQRFGLLLAKEKSIPPPEKSPLEKVTDRLKAAAVESKSFMMAAVAGTFAGTCMFPVDTAKVRMQACAQAEQAVAANLRAYSTTLQTMRKIMIDEGLPALYKGLAPVLIGTVPEMAVQVASYEASRDFFSDKLHKDKFSLGVQLGAGCVSGAARVAVSNPLEVLKIRGQVLGKAGGSLVLGIKGMGVKGLYKGVGACWARDISFSAFYFPLYSYSKRYLERKGLNNQLGNSLMAGFVAGAFGAVSTTPFDVIKTRLQNPNTANVVYKSALDCFRRTLKEEGWQSLFVGVGPRVGRVAPYLALSLATYELIKNGAVLLEKRLAEREDLRGGTVGKIKGKGRAAPLDKKGRNK